MRIAKIKIENILGIEDLEITAGGTLNIIQGQNGKGKTSVLEAIKVALGSGSDATILRKGETKGRVVLLMDDKTEVSANVNASGKISRSVVREGQKSSQPATDIREIADAIGINPAEFIANPKSRSEIIIRALNYRADTSELKEMFGIDFPDGGVEVLDQVRKYLFDERTGVNRSLKEKEATINQMKESLSDEIPHSSEIESKIVQLRSEIDDLTSKASSAQSEIRSKYFSEEESLKKSCADALMDLESKMRQIKSDALSRENEAKAKMDEEILEIRSRMEEEIRAVRERQEGIISKIREEADSSIRTERVISESDSEKKKQMLADLRERIDQEIRSSTDGIAEARQSKLEEISAAQERLKMAFQQEQIKETIQKMMDQKEGLSAESSMLTSNISVVDEMKKDAFKSIPIEGLSVEDGRVLIDGIDFDRVNTAKQIQVAMQVACMRNSKLKAICVDGIEALDSESMVSMMEWAEENDCQLFVTRVTDSDIEFKSE